MTRHLPLALTACLLTAGLCAPVLRAQPAGDYSQAPIPGKTWGNLTQEQYNRLTPDEQKQYQGVTVYGPHRPEDVQLRGQLEVKAVNTMSDAEIAKFKELSLKGEDTPELKALQDQALKYAGYLDGSAQLSQNLAGAFSGMPLPFMPGGGDLMASGLNAHALMAENQAKWLRDQIQVSKYVAECGANCRVIDAGPGAEPQGLMFNDDGTVSVMTAYQTMMPKSCEAIPACASNREFADKARELAAKAGEKSGGENNFTANNTPVLPDAEKDKEKDAKKTTGTSDSERAAMGKAIGDLVQDFAKQQEEQKRDQEKNRLTVAQAQELQGSLTSGKGSETIDLDIGTDPTMLEEARKRVGAELTKTINNLNNDTLTHQIQPDAVVPDKKGGMKVCRRDDPKCG